MSIVGNATSDTVTFSVDYAEKNYYLVRNNTGSTIPKGTLVSASGAEPSGRIDVAPHSTTGTQDSELRVMGMATANISNGVNSEVISFGTLVGIDTRGDTASAIAVGDETWAEGDILYAHPTVPGKLTKVRPQHDLAVAFITVRHASTGQIAVRIIPGNHHLEWLHDVAIDGTPADNELLAYNSATSTWINQTASEAGLQPTISVGSGLTLTGANITVNPAGMLNTIVDGTSGNSYGLVGTSAYLDVKDTNGYNKEIELDIAAVESKLTTDGFVSTSGATFTGNVAGTNINVTNQLISTVATGTSPLSVASTTVVTNLTAQLATQVNTVANTTSATFFPTFVDANNGSSGAESVYTDGDLTYNPSTNVLTAANLTISGTINANAITVAQQKNAAVVSGYNSASGAFAHASKVIMSANATGSSAPTTRPDGTSLAAGDVWISW
jgi:hypothetical protein